MKKKMIVWKIGSIDRPADDATIKDFRKLLKKKTTKKFLKKLKAHNIVTHHAVEMNVIELGGN